jgi:hypothetical protein
MGLLDDVKQLVDKAVGVIEQASDNLTKDLQTGINTIDSAVDDLQTELKKDVDNLGSDFEAILKQAAEGWNTFSSDLNTIRSVISGWYSSADTTTAIASLKSMATQRDLKDAYGQLMPLYKSLTTAATNAPGADAKALAKIFSEFGTFSVSFGGDASVLADFDGGIGFATKTGNDADWRFTADLAVGLGADLEIDAFENVGLWNKSPHDMKGAYFAASAAGADAGGASVGAIFEFPSMSLIGFIFAVEEGEGIEIDGKLGYTMTWDTPGSSLSSKVRRPSGIPGIGLGAGPAPALLEVGPGSHLTVRCRRNPLDVAAGGAAECGAIATEVVGP